MAVRINVKAVALCRETYEPFSTSSWNFSVIFRASQKSAGHAENGELGYAVLRDVVSLDDTWEIMI